MNTRRSHCRSFQLPFFALLGLMVAAQEASSQNNIKFEAESGALVSPMASGSLSSASGGQYVRSTVSNQGSATYRVSVPVSGTWTLWVRSWCASSARDTFRVTVDGMSQYFDANYNAWVGNWRWDRLSLRVGGSVTNHAVWNLALAQGAHVITFAAVDLGAGLDAFVLTDDPKYIPGGATPTTPSNPVNAPPSTNAGPDQLVWLPNSAQMYGVVNDDGRSGPLTIAWSQVSGPAGVTFGSPTLATTSVSLPAAGKYTLRLTANDGVYTASDDAIITVTAGAAYVASPTGSPQGDGSLNNPWDLQTALNHPAAVKAGDTIFLRGGTYKYTKSTGPYVQGGEGLFTSRLLGAIGAPIRVTAYPGESPVIDGAIPQLQVKNYAILKIWGAHSWFIGLEFTNSDPNGRNLYTWPPCYAPYSPPFSCDESNRGDRRGSAVDVFGPGVKLINNIVHDAGQGIGMWSSAIDSEAYGNVLYNNGWDASNDFNGKPSLTGGRLAGHGLYAQNNAGVKQLRENIVFGNFGDGIHLNGSGSSSVANMNLDGNIQFSDLFQIGGPPVSDITVSDSFLYGTSLAIGGSTSGNTRITVRDNHLINNIGVGFDGRYLSNLKFDRNVVRARIQVSLFQPQGVALSNLLFTNNTYYNATPGNPAPKDFQVFPWGGQFYEYPFATWRSFSSTFDAQSTWGNAPTQPSLFFRSNAYDARRGHVVVVNWNGQLSLSIPGTAIGLNVGDAYELHNAANYYGDVIKGVFTGGSITVSLTSRTLAKPVGFYPLAANPYPSFGAFVLIKN